MLSSCSDEVSESSHFLNGIEKTPIAVNMLLETEKVETRAVDESFEAGENKDQLLAYIRHVKTEDPSASPIVYTEVTGTGVASRLAKFEVTALTNGHTDKADNYTDHTETSTLGMAAGEIPLYWDDFSASTEDGSLDLRTDNHALEVYYGYCYNGGVPTGALTPTTGDLGWTVQADQSVSGNYKKSDLLFADRQDPVSYDHGTNNTINGRNRVLSIPYSHAMSRVTVQVNLADGFLSNVDGNFGSAKIKLQSVKTVSSVSAPTKTVTPSGDASIVTMQKGTIASDKKSCTFRAIVAPSLVKADAANPFMILEDFDGNNYKVFLTDDIIRATNSSITKPWSSKLAAYNSTSIQPDAIVSYETGNGGLMIPGVNYHIQITLKKQEVSVRASIRDWSTVNAEAEGNINLNDEVYYIQDDPIAAGQPIEVKTVDKDKFKSGATFSLFTVKHESATDTPAKRINNRYEYKTVCSFVNETDADAEDKWQNTPEIYWPNTTDQYYFRALATYKGLTNNEEFITEKVGSFSEDKGVSVTQGTIAEGHDIIWANTPRHIGKVTGSTTDNVYGIGDAIPPRKGGVPMAFEHIMTKVTFNLEDVNKGVAVPTDGEGNPVGADDPLNPRVNLERAKIQITNLATSGTIQIENGDITFVDSDKREKIFGANGYIPAMLNCATNSELPVADDPSTEEDETTKLLKDFMVIPQTIPDDAKLIVTLANGATYSIQLNTCKVVTGRNTDGTPIYGSTPIGEWKRGENYTYTILLEKEKMEFRVMIKKWDDPEEGGGKATLDWD